MHSYDIAVLSVKYECYGRLIYVTDSKWTDTSLIKSDNAYNNLAKSSNDSISIVKSAKADQGVGKKSFYVKLSLCKVFSLWHA